MEAFKILVLTTTAAVGYGILHDQLTARVCVEYFTVGHPPIFATTDPTLLALGWGTLATWWFGLFLGVPLALMARLGPPPRVPARMLIAPVLRLFGGVGTCAFLAGTVGYVLGTTELASVIEPVTRALPPEKHAPYLADSFAHAAAYLGGFVGASFVWIATWRQRDS
jgi:hypothetical protein